MESLVKHILKLITPAPKQECLSCGIKYRPSKLNKNHICPECKKVWNDEMNTIPCPYTLLYVLLWQSIYFSMFLHFFITTAIKEASK